MAMEEVKKRFAEEIKLRGYDDKYIDKNEEREILQFAIAQGISIDTARAALAQVCDHDDYILESCHSERNQGTSRNRRRQRRQGR